MRTLPGEIMNAARINGASEFGIYWRIVMPLTGPIISFTYEHIKSYPIKTL